MNRFTKGLVLVVVASFITREVEAQSIASRVSSAKDGKVRFTFAPKPDVCGTGNSISRGGSNRMNWTSSQSEDVTYDEECSHTPVRMVLSVRDGKVTKVRTYVGGQWRNTAEPTTDLGAVSTRDATNYLLALASSATESRVGQEAILPAMLADSVNVYPQLIRLARATGIPNGTRTQATFWLGQAAADVVAPDRDDVKSDDNEEIKKQAVFAISQRRREDSVPALIQIAKNNRDPQVRRSALFWLGQTGDPRAISVFEEILNR